jgi:PadR family transcriptional regulator AphA
MNARTLILAILNFRDASGYEIKKMTSEGPFSYFVDISFGSIYPMLARLESEGKVTGRSEAQAGKPDRRIYSITHGGRMELVAGLSHPTQKDVFKSEFMLLAMNADLIGETVIRAAIERRISQLSGDMEMIAGAADECDHPATQWIARYGRHMLGRDIAYLKEHGDEIVAIARNGLPSQQAAE